MTNVKQQEQRLWVPNMAYFDETNPIEVPWGSSVEVGVGIDRKPEILVFEDFMREMGRSAFTIIDNTEYYADSNYTFKPWSTTQQVEEGEQ